MTQTLIVADHIRHAQNYARKHNVQEATIVTPYSPASVHGMRPKTIIDIRRGRTSPRLNRRMDEALRMLKATMPQPTRTATIQDRFEKFHAENPHILARLEEMTSGWLSHGNDRASIHMLWELLRWQQGTGMFAKGEDFKLNDHFPARYARLMVDRHPEWASVFHLRELRAA